MKIYTKTGDTGETGLFGGPRVSKDAPRIEAYGTVDELNSTLGLARAEGLPPAMETLLSGIQSELFDLGAELATPDPAAMGTRSITAARVAVLEEAIDHYEAGLQPLKGFILPAGSRAACLLHVARTVCRRAERRLVTLAAHEPNVSPDLVVYLNRLSDLLFVLARAANASVGQEDVPWQRRP